PATQQAAPATQQPAPATQQAPAPDAAKPAPEAPKPTPAGPVKPPAASGTTSAVDNDTYILGAEDVITVRVWRETDLSGPHTIRPDGKITMPLIKEIQAAGLTPNKVAEAITAALSKFINSPDVAVSVDDVRSRRYFVDGEINRPGAYPLATPTNVFEAITLAGGFREFANKKHIVILRGDKRIKFNWSEVLKGKNLSQNINLENGDRIMVQ
ncbi:MAG TPA: polysaccharide biosynthesis/export family protein, partial [Bryobacteraceae bacterium]|nr:polysaccharide biosynthesis/export family protein [Bryobacteraceae bacterium]